MVVMHMYYPVLIRALRVQWYGEEVLARRPGRPQKGHLNGPALRMHCEMDDEGLGLSVRDLSVTVFDLPSL